MTSISPPAMLLRLVVRFYRYFISPMLGPRCRFAPSCSEYAMDALAAHGAAKGSWLAVKRIARCHPWGGSGYDPVPGGKGHSLAANGCDNDAPHEKQPMALKAKLQDRT